MQSLTNDNAYLSNIVNNCFFLPTLPASSVFLKRVTKHINSLIPILTYTSFDTITHAFLNIWSPHSIIHLSTSMVSPYLFKGKRKIEGMGRIKLWRSSVMKKQEANEFGAIIKKNSDYHFKDEENFQVIITMLWYGSNDNLQFGYKQNKQW